MPDSVQPDLAIKPRRRRWWQFSLRGLFLLVTLCAAALYGKIELDWQRKKAIADRWAMVVIHHEAQIAESDVRDDLLNSRPLACPEPLDLPEQLSHRRHAADYAPLAERLLRSDYDRLCPLTVRPQPTEIVRLGLLLTEFDAPNDSRGK